jgi:anti-anti-sigma factor
MKNPEPEFILRPDHGQIRVDIPGVFQRGLDSSLTEALSHSLEGPARTVILNLQNTRMITSRGISVLFKIQEMISQKQGSLIIQGANPEIVNLFKTLHLYPLFTFLDS